ncbi:MAG: hypothetical protein J0M07_07350 [Anaerolineae bacterium]|nr:hypothetical protein [Anaerolineae bacterium]
MTHLVEESALPVKQTLAELDVPRSIFSRWYARYRQAATEGLAPHSASKF